MKTLSTRTKISLAWLLVVLLGMGILGAVKSPSAYAATSCAYSNIAHATNRALHVELLLWQDQCYPNEQVVHTEVRNTNTPNVPNTAITISNFYTQDNYLSYGLQLHQQVYLLAGESYNTSDTLPPSKDTIDGYTTSFADYVTVTGHISVCTAYHVSNDVSNGRCISWSQWQVQYNP